MKWNGWCVDKMSACLKLKTNVVLSFIINQWRNMYMEQACNIASWTNLVELLWRRSLILVTCHASPIHPLKALTSSNSASAFLPSTFTDCTNSHPPNPTTSTSSCCIISLHLGSRCSSLPLLEGIDHVHLDLQGIWKVNFGRRLFMP